MVSNLERFEELFPAAYKMIRAEIIGGAPLRRRQRLPGGDIDIYKSEMLDSKVLRHCTQVSTYKYRIDIDHLDLIINVLNPKNFPTSHFDIKICKYSAKDYDEYEKDISMNSSVSWERAFWTTPERIIKYMFMGVKFGHEDISKAISYLKDPGKLESLSKENYNK